MVASALGNSSNKYYSQDYYDMFVAPAEELFDENKNYIDEVLKPDNEKKYAFQLKKQVELDASKRNYRSIFLQEYRLEENIKQLEVQKKLAEDRVKTELLKQQMPLSEVYANAKKAGEQYKKQISDINFYKKPTLAEALSNSTKNLTLTDNAYNNAHQSYMSSDMELTGSLFSQTQLALNINMNTTNYVGLIAMEKKTQSLNLSV